MMRRPLVLAVVIAALYGAVAAGAASAAPGEPVAADRDCLRDLRGLDLQTVTIPRLQQAMADGTITSVDLVDAYRARIAAYAEVNAIRMLDPTAREDAAALDAERRAGRIRGPLHGIPVLLKDNVGTGDLPTTAGSVALEGQIPRRDAFLTARLRAAGAVVLGKTNLSEWANWMATGMPNGYSSLGGQVRNAHDGGDPSGSSAGSGVASSLALAAATIGTETSGSILSPSLENGIVGLKTTRGLVSRTGIIPLAERFDVPGPMVRTVADAAVVLSAIAGTDPEDPATAEAAGHLPAGGDYTSAAVTGPGAGSLKGVRIAYDPSEAPSSGAQGDAYDAALRRLTAAGAVLVESGGFGNADLGGTAFELPAIFTQFHEGLDHYLQTEQRDGARVHSLAEVIAVGAQQPDRTKYGQDKLITSEATPPVKELGEAQAQPGIDMAHAAIDDALDAADAVAFLSPGGAHIGIGAAGGHPTIAVPLGHPDGDRFGVTFLGRRYSEAALLTLGASLEAASPKRIPPTQVQGGVGPASCAAAAGAPFTGGPGGTTATTTTLPALKVVLARAPFSARRATRLGGVTVRVRVRGAVLRSVRVRIADLRGRTLLSGSAPRLTGTARVRMRRRAALRPGRARLLLTAQSATGATVRASRPVRLTR